MATPEKLHALAATLRLPNLPSVWSNTITGFLIGWVYAGLEFDDTDSSQSLTLICLVAAASCLFFAGNLLNDWADRQWDTSHRPERALPRGLFRPTAYLAAAILLLAVAWLAAGITGIPALVTAATITAAILIYTWLHKRTPWSVLPMAVCRALLPVMGYFASHPDPGEFRILLVIASPLLLYMIMLSMAARAESMAGSSASIPAMLGLLLPPALWLFLMPGRMPALFGMGPYLLWILLSVTVYRKPVPRLVSALLAGIPLVDGMIMLTLIHDEPSAAPLLMWIWLPAFILCRLLQRVVPAT